MKKIILVLAVLFLISCDDESRNEADLLIHANDMQDKCWSVIQECRDNLTWMACENPFTGEVEFKPWPCGKW